MSLEEPEPNVPEEKKPIIEKKPEEPKPQRDEEEPDNGEDEEKAKEDYTKTPQGDKRISVIMYGIISGQNKCPVCSSAHKFFSNPKSWKKFKFKFVDVMSQKGLKTAEKQGITEMPFFRVQRKGEHKPEWITGFNSIEWEEMQP